MIYAISAHMFKFVIGSLLGLAVVAGLAWTIAQSQAGIKPTKTIEPSVFSWEAEFEAFLGPLEQAYLNDKTNPDTIRNYAKALEQILSIKFIPEIAVKLISVNQSLLDLDEKYATHESLSKQADLLFGVKQFDLAEMLYRKLLEKNSDDSELRGRLASALSFQGKYNEALAELQKILDKQPNAFQALAYMGITYAQMGEMEKALAYTEKALVHAPSDEAKKRLQIFINKLKPATKDSDQDKATDELEPVRSYLKAHTIAGPKFVSCQIEKQTLEIYMQDFPMDQMPEFARVSFINNLKDSIPQQLQLKELALIDQSSGKVMYTEHLATPKL